MHVLVAIVLLWAPILTLAAPPPLVWNRPGKPPLGRGDRLGKRDKSRSRHACRRSCRRHGTGGHIDACVDAGRHRQSRLVLRSGPGLAKATTRWWRPWERIRGGLRADPRQGHAWRSGLHGRPRAPHRHRVRLGTALRRATGLAAQELIANPDEPRFTPQPAPPPPGPGWSSDKNRVRVFYATNRNLAAPRDEGTVPVSEPLFTDTPGSLSYGFVDVAVTFERAPKYGVMLANKYQFRTYRIQLYRNDAAFMEGLDHDTRPDSSNDVLLFIRRVQHAVSDSIPDCAVRSRWAFEAFRCCLPGRAASAGEYLAAVHGDDRPAGSSQACCAYSSTVAMPRSCSWSRTAWAIAS